MSQLFPQDIELMHKPYLRLTDKIDPQKEIELVIRVGRIPHPMEPNHYIKWIEIWQNKKLLRREEFDPLKDKEAKLYFVLPKNLEKGFPLIIKSFCNLHGSHQTELDLKHFKDLEIEKEY